jgi:hypothetical protein
MPHPVSDAAKRIWSPRRSLPDTRPASGPASINRARRDGSSVRRVASAMPAEPPPTMMSS